MIDLGKYEKYPHFLKSRHQVVTRNFERIKKEVEESIFVDRYDGSLEYTYGEYCIIEPQSTKDILREASEMHNCVASYIDKIISDTTRIVFMRKRKEKDNSLVTVEVKKGHICQAYQQSNTPITAEQHEFLEKYAKNKNFILDNI